MSGGHPEIIFSGPQILARRIPPSNYIHRRRSNVEGFSWTGLNCKLQIKIRCSKGMSGMRGPSKIISDCPADTRRLFLPGPRFGHAESPNQITYEVGGVNSRVFFGGPQISGLEETTRHNSLFEVKMCGKEHNHIRAFGEHSDIILPGPRFWHAELSKQITFEVGGVNSWV